MKHINLQQLNLMPNKYRAHLVNSLSGFKSANLIATINNQGKTNLAMISSVIHLGASPALVAFISRPPSASRHTLENIKQTKQYTINQVSENFYVKAHQTSARYLRDESEFKATGLDEFYLDGHLAPFVNQSSLKYSVTLKQVVPIQLNGTQLVIGEITDIICDKNAIKNDGYIDIESLNTVTISGLDNYHTSNRLSRLTYAKTDHLPRHTDINGKVINALS